MNTLLQWSQQPKVKRRRNLNAAGTMKALALVKRLEKETKS